MKGLIYFDIIQKQKMVARENWKLLLLCGMLLSSAMATHFCGKCHNSQYQTNRANENNDYDGNYLGSEYYGYRSSGRFDDRYQRQEGLSYDESDDSSQDRRFGIEEDSERDFRRSSNEGRNQYIGNRGVQYTISEDGSEYNRGRYGDREDGYYVNNLPFQTFNVQGRRYAQNDQLQPVINYIKPQNSANFVQNGLNIQQEDLRNDRIVQNKKLPIYGTPLTYQYQNVEGEIRKPIINTFNTIKNEQVENRERINEERERNYRYGPLPNFDIVYDQGYQGNGQRDDNARRVSERQNQYQIIQKVRKINDRTGAIRGQNEVRQQREERQQTQPRQQRGPREREDFNRDVDIEPLGQFTQISLKDAAENENIIEVLSYLKTSLNSKIFQSSEVISIQQQAINGYNFKFIIRLRFCDGKKLKYQILVSEPLNEQGRKTIQIIDTSYYGLEREPTFTNVKGRAAIEQIPYINTVDQQILAQLFANEFVQPTIVDVSVSLPYYLITYKLGDQKVDDMMVDVKAIYDVLVNKVTIINSEVRQNRVLDVERPLQVGISQREDEQRQGPGANAQDRQRDIARQIIRQAPRVNVRQIEREERTIQVPTNNFRQETRQVRDRDIPQITRQTPRQQIRQNIDQIDRDNIEEIDRQNVRQIERDNVRQIERDNTRDDNVRPNIRQPARQIPAQNNVKQIRVPADIRKQAQRIIGQNLEKTKQIPIQRPSTQPSQQTAKIIHQQIKKRPQFTISLEKTVESIASLSDSAFLPALEESIQSIDQNVIQAISEYLIDEIPIKSDFNIILINDFDLAVRIVLTTRQDHKMFQCFVEIERDRQTNNRIFNILLWRQVNSISEIYSNIHEHYFPVKVYKSQNKLDPEIDEILQTTLNTQKIRNKIGRILGWERRIAYDGIYNRFIIENADNKHAYQLLLFSNPSINFNEVLQYQFLSNDYKISNERIYRQIPTKENNPQGISIENFEAARKFIFSHYQKILKGSSLVFFAVSSNPEYQFYRMVFLGVEGRYEAIVSVTKSFQVKRTVNLMKWQKLQDGYVQLNLDTLRNTDKFKQIDQQIEKYVSERLNIRQKYRNLQVRQVPGVCNFYRFFYDSPIPFTISYRRDINRQFSSILGLESIKIVPNSPFYNDRLFGGFSDLKISTLKFDENYRIFESILLESKYGVRKGQYEEIAGFWYRDPTQLIYRIIYQMNDGQFLATFVHNYVSKEYFLKQFVNYKQQNEPGAYSWKCKKQLPQGLCQECQDASQYILTSGRCYKKTDGCQFQIGSICQACYSGFILTNGRCWNNPTSSLERPKQFPKSESTLVTTTDSKKIVYESGSDINCLVYNGPICSKCAYRFYLNNGVCQEVADSCERYDGETGQCLKCYSGYYLQKSSCIPMDPLCLQASSTGYCQICYNGYINIEGKCYFQSNVSNTRGNIDRLCIKWGDNKCLACGGLSWLNPKTGKCELKDPHCSRFDQISGLCTACNRGYDCINGKCALH